MFFQVHTTPGAHKPLSKLNGGNNLLSSALNRMSGGLRIDRSREEASDSGVSKPRDRDASGVGKRPGTPTDALADDHSDKFVASAGGLARMGGLAETLAALKAIDPELAGHRLLEAKRQIVQNPENALGAQANQSPDFVMKLLE